MDEKKCQICGFAICSDSAIGVYCTNPKCRYGLLDESDITASESQNTNLFSEESLKSLRGVPCNEIIFGSESKGRIRAVIPVHIPRKNAENIIKELVDILKYGKDYARSIGLDVSGRGEKNDG